jgi:nucleoporin NUP159
MASPKAKKASLKPEDDAPLPPDFLSQKKSAPKADDAPQEAEVSPAA